MTYFPLFTSIICLFVVVVASLYFLWIASGDIEDLTFGGSAVLGCLIGLFLGATVVGMVLVGMLVMAL